MVYSESGLERVLESLSTIGADSLLALPGVDELTTAPEYMRKVLALMKPRGIDFDQAWSSAINRIQAPQGEGGYIEDPRVGQLVLDERAMLEEDRPHWRARYEGRAETTREKATRVVAYWQRLESGRIRNR